MRNIILHNSFELYSSTIRSSLLEFLGNDDELQ